MWRKKFTLTRAELYKKVWATPLRKLAPEYGLSDVGLGKLCRRHNIPLPSAGYWTRIQFGQKPECASLPPATDLGADVIEILPSEPHQNQQSETKEKIEYPKIEVAVDREIVHPIALRFQRLLSRSRTDERGVLLAKEEIVPLKIASESLPRVLRICDVLFSALEQKEHTISWPKPYNTALEIIINDEKIRLSVSEALKRKEKPLSQSSSHLWKEWEYTPTGDLKLTLNAPEFSWISKTWKDGKRQRLETFMGEIVVECERTAQAIKQDRQKRIEDERRRIEEHRRQAQEAARQAEYDRKAKVVQKFAQDRRESKLIKRFARELQTASDVAEVAPELKQDLQKMIDWSLEHADYVDPLTDLSWMIGQFKKQSWYGGF